MKRKRFVWNKVRVIKKHTYIESPCTPENPRTPASGYNPGYNPGSDYNRFIREEKNENHVVPKLGFDYDIFTVRYFLVQC